MEYRHVGDVNIVLHNGPRSHVISNMSMKNKYETGKHDVKMFKRAEQSSC